MTRHALPRGVKHMADSKSSAHEAEKQYECSFCGNRFKNNNEMERHQKSIHLSAWLG
ncbi:hypothetical protein BGZ61DRAFT_467930 [Ilyonectria robusta]|uniref:uncharacterized protein n=1 Tax=Ilyonectria robusta TaxID=1079257 RepID=UPI001E8E1A66|nr:uncharacterized protein BGZ61DRAFT_467930 [Ilyonectria robusta]KAH8654203.1 hypothetical protein BGZ61DRAFT_467930 [Ilyonectria robusta]